MEINRRTFLAGTTAAVVSTMLPRNRAQAAVQTDSWGSLIDLTLCDGCQGTDKEADKELAGLADLNRYYYRYRPMK